MKDNLYIGVIKSVTPVEFLIYKHICYYAEVHVYDNHTLVTTETYKITDEDACNRITSGEIPLYCTFDDESECKLILHVRDTFFNLDDLKLSIDNYINNCICYITTHLPKGISCRTLNGAFDSQSVYVGDELVHQGKLFTLDLRKAI